MSKRSRDVPKDESREERWLRKVKFYEEKIEAKRRRQEDKQNILPDNSDIDRDVQTEDNLKSNEVIFAEPAIPTDYQYPSDDVILEDYSQLSFTTAPPSPSSNPSDDTNDLVAIDDFDPDLLRELGEADADPVEYGDDIQADVAARFQKILLEGLKKEQKEELLKKYPFPKNVPLAKSPTLNPELGAMLVDICKARDKRLLVKQDQLGKALSALGKGLSGLLRKNPDIPEVIRTLNDAGRLLADSHFAETETRRSVLIPLIDKSLTEPFKDRKRDFLLFGDKLGDLVKDSRGIKKTGQLIQPPGSISSNLNTRGPSSRPARHQRSGGQTYPHRAGGPRTATTSYQYPYPYPSRRRAGPPAPPARRHAAPLAPPPPAQPPRRPPPAHRAPNGRSN